MIDCQSCGGYRCFNRRVPDRVDAKRGCPLLSVRPAAARSWSVSVLMRTPRTVLHRVRLRQAIVPCAARARFLRRMRILAALNEKT